MSEREENDLLADAVRRFREAQRKSKLIASRLYAVGFELRQIANDLSPADPTIKPHWESLREKLGRPRSNELLVDVVDIARLAALLDEWVEHQRTIERLGDVLDLHGGRGE